VGYFAEFRDVIKREENAINHELVSMQDLMADLKSILEMLNSLEKQANIVHQLSSSKSAPEELKK